MPADNIVVSGKFTANSYTVTYMVDGVQQGEVETYNFGDSITLRAEPTKTGYSFGGWKIENSSTAPLGPWSCRLMLLPTSCDQPAMAASSISRSL